jgi:hypothetical protein
MKLAKIVSPFVLLLIIGVITFRFIFFISYIKVQKHNFRDQLIKESKSEVFEVQLAEGDLFIDKPGFDWKENNKELVIEGVYHEVIAVKKINGKAFVSLIEDKAENTLFKNFFCANKGIHKDFADLIKLLLNLTYLENNNSLGLIKVEVSAQLNVADLLFEDFKFYLKQIKPPRF